MMRALSLLLCMLLLAPVTFAADSAETLVRRARKAYEQREYRRAAELFEKAHSLDPVASLKVNAAQAWRLAGDLPRAADAYAAALATGDLTKADTVFARDKLADIEKQVATLRVDEPRGKKVSVAHAEGVSIPVVVHVMPGSHQVLIEDDGKIVKRTVELQAGEARTLSVVSEPKAARAAPEPTASAPARVAPSPKPPPPDEGIAPLRIGGWVTLALGIALGGVTTYFGIRTLDAADRWKTSNLTDLDAHDEAVTFKTATNVTLTVAIAAGAAGILMLVIPIDDTESANRRSMSVAF